MIRDEYNSERPYSSLGYRTPNEFAEILKSSAYDWLRKTRQVKPSLLKTQNRKEFSRSLA